MKICPCGSEIRFLDCCGAYLRLGKIPDSPEILMRSRYTAFVEDDLNYIKKTMRPPASLNFKKDAQKRKIIWTGLSILTSASDPENPNIGYVEFKASYVQDNIPGTLHEKSVFHFLEGRWYYVDSIN